jgi:hypothetical protein
VDALRQGNPLPLLSNAARVLGMFGVSGDPEWRYNVALRPIFDPAWAILFYAGIGLTAWRFKRPAYAFTLLWLVVMLLPSILSGSDLSQHRAVGAIGAAFILPALALDELRVQVTQRWGKPGQSIAWIATAALVLLAAYGGINAYFVTWASHPEVRLIQRADLATAARWLDAHQTNERALVSAEFANDLDRGSFELIARTKNKAQFFQGADTFVLPARAGAFIVNPRSGAIHESFKRQFLSGDPVFTGALVNGVPEVEIYELTEEEFQILRTTRGLNTVARTADGQILIRDAHLPRESRSGDVVNAELWWEILSPQISDAENPTWTGALEDAMDFTWSETASLGYTPSQWQREDMVVTLLPLPVPVDAPPQRYALNVALVSSGRPVPLVKGAELPAAPIELGELSIERGPVPRIKPELQVRYPSKAQFGDVQLLGSDAVGEAEAGGVWRLLLFWSTSAKLSGNYKLRLIALTEDGQEIACTEDVLLKGIYPTRQWRAGDYVRSIHDLEIPADAPRGKTVVRVSLLTPDGNPLGRADGFPIAGIEIVGRARVFVPPSPQESRLVRFGDAIELVGYDLAQTTLTPGATVELTLYWRARQAAAKPYTVFVHLLEAGGKVAGQKDSEPLQGQAPTNTWQAGEYITDTYAFPLAPDAIKGKAFIEFGFYDGTTGQRLPVSDERGANAGDHVLIQGLVIE